VLSPSKVGDLISIAAAALLGLFSDEAYSSSKKWQWHEGGRSLMSLIGENRKQASLYHRFMQVHAALFLCLFII
jgi:hypothetical protein